MGNRLLISPHLRLVAMVLCVLLLGITALGVATSVTAQAPNLLQNPGFEGDYAPFGGDVRRVVAAGWSPWNVARRAGEPSWSNNTPQYLPADVATAVTGRVRSGSRAQEYFELYATFNGGVYQQVSVAPGTPLRFTAWINIWSSEGDSPATSANPGEITAQVGIDPTGGTNGESGTVVWGSSQTFYDEYRELAVDSTAQTSRVTVFVRVTILDPVRHNHVYVDDASLTVTGPVTGTLVPPPTSTPTATLPAGSTPPFIPTREGTVIPGGPSPIVPTREVPGAGTPLPTLAPDVPDLPGRVTYTVRSGDTVSQLAARFGSRADAIILVNGLRSDGLIRVGQTLLIPVSTPPTAIPTIPPAFPSPTPIAGGPLPPVTGGLAPVEVAVLDGPTVGGIGTYIMQAGDTLEAVARRYRTTVAYLARLNGIVNPALLVIGQVLAVPGPGNNRPGGTAAPTIIPTSPSAPGIPGARTHVVQPGENLLRISLRYNVTIAALMIANGIPNTNLIYAGQVLRIP